jgi:Lar family restriction alleviation protein
MTTIAQDLGGVVLLPCPFCGGDPIMWAATDCKDGFVHGTTINCPSCGISINDEYQDAAITAWNTRAHSAEIAGALRDAERWQPIESAPPHNRKNYSMGTEYMIWPPPSSGERTAFFGRRLGGKATWYKYGAPVHGVTHWRPLPAPPTQDSAMQQGGGGGEVAA